MASVLDVKSKEEKDAELDRKIEALRKKNEALVRRHQMIEEDRKMAEQEGIAVTTPRKAKHLDGEPDKARKEKENFSITLDVSAGEKRVVNDGKSPKAVHTPPRSETSPRSPTHRTSGRTGLFSGGRTPPGDKHGEPFKGDGDGDHHPSERPTRGRRIQVADMSKRSPRISNEESPGERWSASPRGAERGGRGPGRGGGMAVRGGVHAGPVDVGSGPDRKVKEWEEKRKLNIEKMNEEMEKIAEYERSQRDGVREKNPIRNFLDDPRRTGPIADIDRKEGSRRHTRNWGGPDFEKVKTGMDREKESHRGRRSGGKNQMDMTMSMTGKERAEYVRWKQERDQIDQERLARHRKPTGQWRREWDAEKTDSMFKEGGGTPHVEEEPTSRRDQGKRGAPKPPTMAEFLPESLKRSTPRRNQNRGRSGHKPYSMHDSRWEEDDEDDDEIANEKDKALPSEEKEKETCVEKAETKKAEEPKKPTSEVSAAAPEVKKSEGKKEIAEDDGVEDDEDWTDASGDEEDLEEEEVEEEEEEEEEEDSLEGEEAPPASAPPATPKEQRLPKQVETPKLTMPPPDMPTEEQAVESKPTSPFSPEGHRPVTDWGEEMELLSPPGSSNEDSPPQDNTTRGFNEDAKSRDFSPSGSNQNLSPASHPVKNLASDIEAESVLSTETKSQMEQTLPERLLEGNVESGTSHEESSPAAGETTVNEETSLSKGGSCPAEVDNAPKEAVSSPVKAASSHKEAVSSPEEAVSSHKKAVSSHEKAVSSSSEAVTSPAEVVSSPVEAVNPPMGAVSSSEETVSSSAEAVSSSAEPVSSLAEPASSPAEPVSSIAEGGSSLAQSVTTLTERTSSAVEETPPLKETSPAAENILAVSNEAQTIAQETSPVVEVKEASAKSVHIADFETQNTEMPPLS